MRSDLPTGTVTLLFTDIEGSTKLLHELGAEGYAPPSPTIGRHSAAAFGAHGGVEVDTEGDAFFVAFAGAAEAVAAASRPRPRSPAARYAFAWACIPVRRTPRPRATSARTSTWERESPQRGMAGRC